MITPDSVIKSLGGATAVAAALSLHKSTVSLWRVRGIPPSHWLALSEIAAERGETEITLEALAKMEQVEARA